MKLLEAEDVLLIHEDVINKHELQDLAGDRSLYSVIGQIENRIKYGIIKDEFDLAANYAVVIAVGHVFNDAKKRTAFRSMDVCLRINGIALMYDTTEIGNIMIKVAQKLIDEIELASYLKSLYSSTSRN